MSQLRLKELLRLPVFTQSGKKIGTILGLVVHSMEHTVLYYEIAPSASLLSFFRQGFLIRSSQVVSLDTKKMIVADSFSRVEVEQEVLLAETQVNNVVQLAENE